MSLASAMPQLLAALRGGTLADAAQAFGLKQETLKDFNQVRDAFVDTAQIATKIGDENGVNPKVETILITGAPEMMKGRKLRIIAVLGEWDEKQG